MTPSTTTLSQADRLEIQDLYGRYGIAIDDGDAEGWAACFTARGGMTVGDQLELNGREELAGFAAAHHESPRGAGRHHFTTIAVTGTEDGAAGRAYSLMTLGGQVTSAMSYVDELVKEDGAWRFARRTVTPA
jgi:uncharacterized protein (TIGR02246 family)